REFGVLSRFLGSDCKPEVVLGQFLRMRSDKTTKTAPNDVFSRKGPNLSTYREFGVLSRFLGSDCKPKVVLGQFLRMRSDKTTKTAPK
ncbi:MAG TPA: hypothetical protein VIJ25_01960, partial [Methylococcales bacterium]